MGADFSIRFSRHLVFLLAVAAVLLCLTYSNSFIAFTNQYGETVSSNPCFIYWKDPYVNTSLYEEFNFHFPEVDSNGHFPLAVSVNILYPNPVIRLRPDHFILPILHNGPNNQLLGLQSTIFVAIKLNRTVVIPKFLKHHTDNRRAPISPEHRLQISDMCSFVSCITVELFREACGYQIDGIFHIRKHVKSFARLLEKDLGMKFLRIPEADGKLTEILVPPEPLPQGRNNLLFHGHDVIKLFNHTGRCMIYPHPLYNLHLPPMSKLSFKHGWMLVEKQEDLKTTADARIMLSIVHHTKSPIYIRDLAEEFFEEVMRNNLYVAVHWRYQPDEFMQRCTRNPSANPVKDRICQNAMSLTPEDIADSIETKIQSLGQGNESFSKIRYIYFATPSSERAVLSGVATTLYKRNNWMTYSSLDLVKFLDGRFRDCPTQQKHYNDILSTTEMEICANAVAFLGSQRSSWSEAVWASRITPKHEHVKFKQDGDVFKLSLKAHQNKTS